MIFTKFMQADTVTFGKGLYQVRLVHAKTAKAKSKLP